MKTKRIIFTILLILHCTLIFYFSNQIADNSNNQSSRVVEFVSNIIPAIRNMNEVDKVVLKEKILTPIVRKGAHLSLYTMLGMYSICFTFSFKNKNELDNINQEKGQNIKKKILYSLLFCIFYSITDEFHQSFIPGRSCEVRDVLIDSIGSLIGIVVIVGGANIWRKK